MDADEKTESFVLYEFCSQLEPFKPKTYTLSCEKYMFDDVKSDEDEIWDDDPEQEFDKFECEYRALHGDEAFGDEPVDFALDGSLCSATLA